MNRRGLQALDPRATPHPGPLPLGRGEGGSHAVFSAGAHYYVVHGLDACAKGERRLSMNPQKGKALTPALSHQNGRARMVTGVTASESWLRFMVPMQDFEIEEALHELNAV
jgi:predicted dienelactone hydrolase